jgi:hypothetical protein
MTIGKGSALAAGFVGAVVVGVAIAPFVTHRGDNAPAPVTPAWDLSQPSSTAPQPTAIDRATPAAPDQKAVRPSRPRPGAAGDVKAGKPEKSTPRAAAKVVPASAPGLEKRLKPVLNRGANMKVAADGFRDAEQFATVAHASRNTKVPFMVLKHHVLNEKQSLADAISAANPALDAAAEARRARTEGRSDVAAVASLSAN